MKLTVPFRSYNLKKNTGIQWKGQQVDHMNSIRWWAKVLQACIDFKLFLLSYQTIEGVLNIKIIMLIPMCLFAKPYYITSVNFCDHTHKVDYK